MHPTCKRCRGYLVYGPRNQYGWDHCQCGWTAEVYDWNYAHPENPRFPGWYDPRSDRMTEVAHG